MRHILGLDLTDVLTFKKASVDFNSNLTFVRGMNLDADPANPTGNGAGKSVFFSTMTNLLLRSVPMSVKGHKKKTMLGRKSSEIGLIYKPSDDGPEYEIVQTPSKYIIYEDGKDLEIRTVPLAEEFIRKLFPLTEIEMYTYGFVSTQRPYLLQSDSDSNRLQHVTDIFKLDQYSTIRDYFAKKARTIADNEVKLGVLEQRLVSIKRKLKDLKPGVDEEAYNLAKKHFETVTAEIDDLQQKRFKNLKTIEALESLVGVEAKLDKLRKAYKHKKKPDEMVKRLKAAKQAAREWEEYDTAHAQVEKASRKIKAQLEALDIPGESKDALEAKRKKLRKQTKDASARIEELDEARREYRAAFKAQSEATNAVDEHAVDRSDVDFKQDYDEEIGALKATLKLEQLLHDDCEDGQCPTCLSPIDLKNIERSVKNAKKKLPRLQELKVAKRLFLELDKAVAAMENVEFDEAEFEKLKKLVNKCEEQIDGIDSDLETYAEQKRLKDQLKHLSLPAEPTLQRPNMSVEQIDIQIDLCREIQKQLEAKSAILEHHEKFREYKSVKKVKQAIAMEQTWLAAKDTEIEKKEKRRSDYATTISAWEQYANTINVYKKELKDTRKEIDKLAPSVAEKKLVSILLKAYGAKGLRSKAAESVCRLLQTNLNHYRDLIFAEPFEFTVQSKETGIAILVDRNNGKPDSVSDVRHLSGAESNAFHLLCLISILPLIPDDRRLNICILDEPTSHMDEPSRQLFRERFLPVLRSIVPHVFVITPHPDDSCANSSEWIVQKHKGVSQIKIAA